MAGWARLAIQLIVYIFFDVFILDPENIRVFASRVLGKLGKFFTPRNALIAGISSGTSVPLSIKVDSATPGTLSTRVFGDKMILKRDPVLVSELEKVGRSAKRRGKFGRVILLTTLVGFVVAIVRRLIALKEPVGDIFEALNVAKGGDKPAALDDLEAIAEANEEKEIIVSSETDVDSMDLNGDGIVSHEEYLLVSRVRRSWYGVSNNIVDVVKFMQTYDLTIEDLERMWGR